MYVKAPTQKSKEDLEALLFDRVPDATAQTLMKKRSIVGLDSERFRSLGSSCIGSSQFEGTIIVG